MAIGRQAVAVSEIIHSQWVVAIKSQTDTYRELKICGDQWRGKKKMKDLVWRSERLKKQVEQ